MSDTPGTSSMETFWGKTFEEWQAIEAKCARLATENAKLRAALVPVVDHGFLWEHEGQVTAWMTKEQFEAACALVLP